MNAISNLSDILDWLFESVVSPIFVYIAQGLELVILKPLMIIGFPPALQVAFVGFITGMLTLFLRKYIRVEEKEAVFQQLFEAKKAAQKPIDHLSDWKTRDVLYRASDKELDESFNTYLAQRFARHGIVYLLPIFFALFWLDNVMPHKGGAASPGAKFVLILPDNSYGIEGLSVSFVFFVAYILTLIAFSVVKKRYGHKRPSLLGFSTPDRG